MELSTRLSTEAIQRAAIVVLFNYLNDMIAVLNQTWAVEDDEYWAALNRGNEEWFVEPIEDKNFYAGTIPSLIKSSIEKYHNLCDICYFANPPTSFDDDGELYNNVLAIEVMVKSINSEEEVTQEFRKPLMPFI